VVVTMLVPIFDCSYNFGAGSSKVGYNQPSNR
jgi:hypothetical protein